MSDYNLMVLVNQDSLRSETEGVYTGLKGTKRGEACIIDFYTEALLEGRGFQIRAGTVTTPLTGDVVITDAKAEMCIDVANGLMAMPVFCNISVRLGTGTLHEYAIKSVDAVSTAGTAFIPLPMLLDTSATAAQTTARVAAAGGVTVTAELATTTRRHWSVSNPLAVAAGHSKTSHNWEPRTPPVIANDACCYVQIAATGTGPSYYANLDFIEMRWQNIS